MHNYYFTFGSWKGFPFQGGYVVVKAADMEEAIAKFRKIFQDKNENTVNCAFYYSEEEWKNIKTRGTCHAVLE